ncbi:uncharacterized protein LOC106669896 isoform X2 [Cimex lectularius]|uniref:F-box domain-containing protein n=1 Tax=Cimex lectularius TaxID=79782 RepID=A0A8I6S148_CIMLE|nr:uncharacterized protein LOC106669896 isoform X2 [Cimex lectularius]
MDLKQRSSRKTQWSVAKRKQSVDDLFDLPEEVLELILGELSLADLIACSEVSKKWRRGVNIDSVWRDICRHESYDDKLMLRSRSHLFIETVTDEKRNVLGPLCYWREVYGWCRRLSKNWIDKKFQTYKLSETSSPVYSLDCDGITAVTGHEDSSIYVWSVEGLPYLVQIVLAVLPDYPIISVKTTTRFIVAIQKKLLHVFTKNDKYLLTDLKSFELGDEYVEQMERYNSLGDDYVPWYKEAIRMQSEAAAMLITPLMYAVVDDRLFAARYGSGHVWIWKLTGSKLVSDKVGLKEISQIESIGSNVYLALHSGVTSLLKYSIDEDEVKPLMSLPGRKKFVISEKLVMAIPAPGDICLKRISVWKKGYYNEPLGTKTISSSHFCAIIAEKILVVYSEDSIVRVWDPFRGHTLYTFSVGAAVGFIRAGFGKCLVVFMNSSLHLWDLKSGKRLYRFYNALEWTGDYRHLVWINHSMILSAGVNHQLEMLSFL